MKRTTNSTSSSPLPSPKGLSRRSLAATGLAFALLGSLAACDQLGLGGASKLAFKGVDLTGAEYARSLNLPDQDGRSRSLADFKGKVVVVFFGYTQCPDVCPTTMAELAEVKRSLGAEGERVQGVFVSVDPERDTPALLKAYMASFDPSFVALRGSEEQTKAAAKEFKVYYAKVPGKTPESYTLDHTAASFIFDPEGRVRVFSRYGSGAQALADDIKLLLAEKR
ncbi:SCO family protein [Paucibacter aquatile]|uniref:SCO family protein n=1 Tax=Kinneretia aquatilis TaxID=2070761 RepID=A0A2N8KWI0_9BURK|nr:SCO family protein [Paucibacter aquatile]PND37800.1 SCO family protein [Paucibacter aquatile]WIV96703.1 SCO family protein [Paucibacter aquatile]